MGKSDKSVLEKNQTWIWGEIREHGMWIFWIFINSKGKMRMSVCKALELLDLWEIF